MNHPDSLADRAIKALSAVDRMDEGVTNENDERHHIRTLKRLAEQQLAEAFHQARELAYLAEEIRKNAAASRQKETT
jgi:hypothetical protein